jgi:hypothetical protein
MDKSLPTVAGIEIPVDSEGRYNLNALHKASGEGEHKRPSKWLDTSSAQEFIDAVKRQSPSTGLGAESNAYDVLKVVKGGNAPGTFAHELIAVEYAGWISPEFRIKVNQTFIDYRTGTLSANPKLDRLRPREIREAFSCCVPADDPYPDAGGCDYSWQLDRRGYRCGDRAAAVRKGGRLGGWK